MRTAWNDREDEALHGLPWIAQLVYLRAIRPHMDYATAIVGVQRGISLKSIAEVLHIESGQGRRDAGDPSQKAVRHALELLERAGLLERIPADRQLVFRLPLADTDSSVSQKWGRRGADVGQTKRGRQSARKNQEVNDNEGQTAKTEGVRKWGTPPVSGIRKDSDPIGSGASAPQTGDPKTAIWDLGERYLGSRAMVGRLVKLHGEARVFHAIAQTATHNPADAKAYVQGLLKGENHEASRRPHAARTVAERGEAFGSECWSRILAGTGLD